MSSHPRHALSAKPSPPPKKTPARFGIPCSQTPGPQYSKMTSAPCVSPDVLQRNSVGLDVIARPCAWTDNGVIVMERESDKINRHRCGKIPHPPTLSPKLASPNPAGFRPRAPSPKDQPPSLSPFRIHPMSPHIRRGSANALLMARCRKLTCRAQLASNLFV